MLSDVYFVDLQMTGMHWIYTLLVLFFVYSLNQILTVQLAPEIKKFFKEKLFRHKKKPIGFGVQKDEI